MSIPTVMPAIGHVAVTVTDLQTSTEWYTRLLGVKPVLDEDTGPFRHVVYEVGGTLLGLHGFPVLTSEEPFESATGDLYAVAVMPDRAGNTATANSAAVRATSLFTADATPTSLEGAAAMTVAVSGATVVAMPSPKTRMPGRTADR